MIVLTPNTPPVNVYDKKLVFLAGPIQGAENWQKDAIADLADLDIYVANPRRDNSADFNYVSQVEWETLYLKKADVIMFWIPAESYEVKGRSYAQTNRFELGEWLGRTDFNRRLNKKIVIGIDNNFPGKRYIIKRCEKFPCPIFDTYRQTITEVRRLLTEKINIFFTSDTHFGSERALVYSHRPFSSVDEMNKALVDNWNKIVKPQDTVWHLGDFGDISFAKQLNGNINLILGNYELDAIAYNSQYLQDLQNTFALVEKNAVITTADGEALHLSHKPSDADRTMFNAFGHIHGLQKCKHFGYDVGVDANHFRPISEKYFLDYKNSIINCYDENVFY